MLERIRSDFWYELLNSPVTVVSAVIIALMIIGCTFAPVFAPHTPFDPATISIMDNNMPPAWADGADPRFLLGTDLQGRDVLSAMLYGGRISLLVGIGAVALSVVIGMIVGLVAGYFGGMTDAVLMRVAEIQFAFPPILIALLFNGILKASLPADVFAGAAVPIMILAIGLAGWVQFARIVRASAMVQRGQDYVTACHAIGLPTVTIILRHITPNILGPVLVLAMLQIAVAIVTEATLSFLGLGTPLTEPSLGALIQIGSQYLFSGIWWVVIFPGIMLLVMVVAFNLVADWVRDYLNPRLR
ncbi:ABC transporter permease [Marinovum sp. 2_MG-2023]|uniref:ABC transporter permease n=1 Tax=unclassified Marinovum TaxID=2647166 RepID=UPI0026E1B363|nr:MULTISPECIES: ABC transporter permease [unclassified Marinovum]MDO6730044.1 ABC transporter permease [Marinovum sp. 2_MG-2023]MDO6779858.1 ABC transporter permease [Marinovum sp. 1_MG-2023]